MNVRCFRWYWWCLVWMALQVNMLQILRPSSQPLFKFGVISDIQYADSPDAWNFQQTKLRRYSNSLKIFEDSVRSWNTANADFSLILGDIIDIRASTTNTQQSCLKTFLNVAAQFKGRNYYCFGNHCLTCFPRVQLKEMMSQQQTQLYYAKEITQSSQPLSYYWNPMPDWCFISLDGYDLSIVSSSSKENEQLAQTLIKQYNPNDLSFGSNKWYHNLPPERCMWTPNNGGFSRDLLQWFDDVLRRSHEQLQKVVIFCHEPVYAPGNPISVAWNYQEVLRILRKYDHVILWLAGHDHDGQCHFDSNGIVHIVPPAPIEREVGDAAYGVFEVFDDRLVFDWKGSLPQWNNPFPWPKEIQVPSHLRYYHGG